MNFIYTQAHLKFIYKADSYACRCILLILHYCLYCEQVIESTRTQGTLDSSASSACFWASALLTVDGMLNVARDLCMIATCHERQPLAF